MSTRSLPDFDSHPTLDAWLDLGPTELSDHVVERARAEIHRTRQRGTRPLSWKASVRRPSRSAATLALIAAVVIAMIGVGIRIASTPAVGTNPSPSPNPTTDSFHPTGRMATWRLTPGTHTSALFKPQITFDIPPGWADHADSSGEYVLYPPGSKQPATEGGTRDWIAFEANVMMPRIGCAPGDPVDTGESAAAWPPAWPGVSTSPPPRRARSRSGASSDWCSMSGWQRTRPVNAQLSQGST